MEKSFICILRELHQQAIADYGQFPATGGPSTILPAPFAWGCTSFSADSKKLVIDRVTRWDVEWRHYRGGKIHPSGSLAI
jgi:hypothetical protein